MSESPTLPTRNTHPLTLDADVLSRAALSFCTDGPDALMFAALKGSQSASLLLSLIAAPITASPPDWLDDMDRIDAAIGKAPTELDRLFIVGTARWGRRADARGMERFHAALERWRERLAALPLCGWEPLADRLTFHGGQWIIGPASPYWPHQLDDLAIRSDWAPPLCLWGMGDPAALVSCDEPVAVVGSRDINDYGRFVARNVGLQAARHGHLVVSGGAKGADAAAHWGALAAREERKDSDDPDHAGRTVAVFAGGVERRGPSCNFRLFDAMLTAGGALVSEMPPGTIPEARRFLLRNRIIAAMAGVVVVAQARHRSGALNTATWAAEMNRTLVAAPGDIDEPYNTGCNRLVHDGKAVLLASATDIGDICHAEHTPYLSVTPCAAAVDEDNRFDTGHADTDRTDGVTPNDSDIADPLQSMMMTAIRALRRRDTVCTADTLLAELRSRHPGKVISVAGAQQALTALETSGRIAVDADGTIAIAGATRARPMPEDHLSVRHPL
ncbi:DNA-processing protein DprA [Bifidobacterium callimiconis]|uniref:DNA-processing protein DprA n=1 Tax=Bifidobacterium callimiconis TaxID=2306973 RepID=UPI001BDBE037|nr:DNA-processing protein DprA [Bifidobacterium callimiconis]MBT1176226.1 DNA-processing protein DprA [Bifidobacterium callimiconis]